MSGDIGESMVMNTHAESSVSDFIQLSSAECVS